jgi:hypothetical protein
MSINRHSVDTSTQASGQLETNYSIAGQSALAEDDGVTMTKQKYDAIIIGTGKEGQPLAKRLSEGGVGTDSDEARRVGSSAA